MNNLIHIERDSVCMGDDIDAPHAHDFMLPENATLQDIFRHLEKIAYLPSVAGLHHSWNAIINDEIIAIFKGNNQSPEHSEFLCNPIADFIKGNKVNLYIKYHSSIN